MTRRTPRPCFDYLRISSASQQDGHGLQRQEGEVRRFAARHGLRVVEVFAETHTGIEAHRPKFAAMLGALQANGTHVVVIERLDRLAREIGVQVTLLGMLQQVGATLIEAATGQDVTAALQDDPMTKAMVSMRGVFHEVEKELLVRKLRRARDAGRAEHGHCEGLLGYGLDPARPDEATFLEILLLAASTRNSVTRRRPSAAQLADLLNQAGAPTRTGGSWTRASVRSILLRSQR